MTSTGTTARGLATRRGAGRSIAAGITALLAITGCASHATSSRATGSVATSSVATSSAATSSEPTNTFVAWDPPALQLLLDSTATTPDLGTDTIEVWICRVPLDTTDQRYNPVPLRLDLTPDDIAAKLERYVSAYYRTLSHDRYTPHFVAGQAYAMKPGDTANDCVDHALAASATTSNAVLAVATAEHTATAPGGFGIVGSPCTRPAREQCSARSTGRAAYVGASDFHPDWGPEPAVDLEEHEIGHLLGWPHSGDDSGEGHSSGLDVMSDSAAPRDVDPARRDGPDTLAVNRLAARWLPIESVVVANPSVTTTQGYTLVPSFAASGPRVLVLDVDARRLLTVELLAKDGFDSFLPHAGVTVTLIDQSPTACGHTDGSPCVGADRVQLTKVGKAPFYDMLTADSPPVTIDGWTIDVTNVGSTATIQVARATTTG